MKKILIIIFASLLIFSGCKNKNKDDLSKAHEAKGLERHQFVFYDYFDTIIEITYFSNEKNEDEVKEKTEKLIKELHDEMNNFEGGKVQKLNKDKTASWPLVMPVLTSTLELERKTGAKLDISKGKLFGIWKETIETGKLPDKKVIEEARKEGGMDSIKIDGDKITLTNGAEIDFGSVCKGYLNERLKELYKSLNIENYIISSGGNVTVKGAPPDGRKNFAIGIEDPNGGEEPFDVIYLTNKSLVTSGDYQRFREIDGVRYHHIIDLETGYPAKNGKRSITIVGDDALICDFLSTTLFLESKEEIEKTIKDFPGYSYYMILDDGTTVISEDLKENIKSLGAKNK